MFLVERVKNWLAPSNRSVGAIVPLLLFALAFLPRVIALSHFITVDEPVWTNRVARFGVALLSNNLQQTYSPQMLDGGGPGITTMWVGFLGLILEYLKSGAAGGLTAFLSLYADGLPSPAALPMFRIVTVFVTSVAVPVLYLELKDWIGVEMAGLGAAFLALDPFYAAHSRVLHHDGLVTAFMALSLASVMVALWRRFSLVRLAFAGGMASLALLSKLMGGFAIPFSLLLFVAAYAWSPVFRAGGNGQGVRRRGQESFKRLLAGILAWGAGLIVAFVVFTPGMWTEPLVLLQALFLRGLEMSDSGHFQFFRGVVNFDPGLLFYYVVWAFRTTPVTFVGLLLSVLALKKPARNVDRVDFARLAFLIVILFPLLLVSSPKKQDRYLLPIFPWIDLLAAIGWLTCLRVLQQWWQGAPSTLGKRFLKPTLISVALLPAVVILQLLSFLSDSPYYLGYYNPLFGGPVAASQMLLIGWGDGLDEAGRYLDGKPDAKEMVISAVPAVGIRPYFSGHVFDFYTNYSGYWADYVVTYISQYQRNVPNEEQQRYFDELEVEYVVERHGVPYAYIYKGAQFTGSPAYTADVAFAEFFRLTGFELITPMQRSDSLQIRLFWQSRAKTEDDYTWSLRLCDHTGHQWAQTDFRPMDGALPTNLWRPGSTIVSDNQTLELPPGMPPGRYTLYLQAYDLATMKTLPVTDETGRSSRYLAYAGSIDIGGRASVASSGQVSVPEKLDQNLTPSIRLIGYGIDRREVSPGEEVVLSLYWQALESVQRDYDVRLDLLGETGDVVFLKKEAPHSRQYPTGRWAQGELVQDRHYLRIPADLQPGTYSIGLSLVDAVTAEASERLLLSELSISGRPHQFEMPPIEYRQTANFGGIVRFLGYGLNDVDFRPNDTVRVTLYWQAAEQIPDNYQVFVHVLDEGSTIQVQHDSIPGLGTLPTIGWLPGEIISDTHEIVLPSSAPPGTYRLGVGLYEPATGQRLRVDRMPADASAGGTDAASEDGFVLLEQSIHVSE